MLSVSKCESRICTYVCVCDDDDCMYNEERVTKERVKLVNSVSKIENSIRTILKAKHLRTNIPLLESIGSNKFGSRVTQTLYVVSLPSLRVTLQR